MNSIYEKYYKAALKIILIAGIFIFIYVLVKYLLAFFAPFVIAIIIAVINDPVIRLLEKKLRMPRKIAALLSMLLTISVLGALLTVGIIKIYNELVILQGQLSGYIDITSDQLTTYFNQITAYFNNLPFNISAAIIDHLKSIGPTLEGIIASLAAYLINTVSSIPKVAVFIIVTFLSAYFISSDRKKISDFVSRQMPNHLSKSLSGIKTDTFTALFGYIKAYIILVSLTFIEVSTGLFILRADYALLMGIVVALSDIIPIFGTGMVMVPWIAWNLIIGNMQMALGLTAIYLLGVIVRQVLEPKIVGDQIGLHPLVTLVAMYLGFSLFGVLGLFIGPVSILILKNLQDAGVIQIWKD